MKTPAYQAYRAAFQGRHMPFAYVDLDLLDENIRAIAGRAGSKTVRVASKSVRCTTILKYILDADPRYKGLMTFTAEETVWLSQKGFDDLLLAYPTWDPTGIKAICGEIAKGKRIVVMLDAPQQAAHLATIAQAAGVELPVCIDLDMSTRFPGIHFGVFRSPVNNVDDALRLHTAIRAHDAALKLVGVMGYEAQIAGLGDDVPGHGFKSPVIRFLKKRSIRKLAARRQQVVAALRAEGADIQIVNGGGTGSMETTGLEESVTEITAGSGFFASHLFDYYRNFRHKPAAGFAIQIVREPAPHIYTCLGGGYIASGSTGIEKQPLPYLPAGATLHPSEGAGEVQTPICYKGPEKLQLGDPVFIRHSKAGELCERFNTLLLLRGNAVKEEAPTYRGEGKSFL